MEAGADFVSGDAVEDCDDVVCDSVCFVTSGNEDAADGVDEGDGSFTVDIVVDADAAVSDDTVCAFAMPRDAEKTAPAKTRDAKCLFNATPPVASEVSCRVRVEVPYTCVIHPKK
ncbi:hypothetical protein skT53_00700 [Effusibacillus dendaii]|uniref:Uncharacterized protein n=1 Tax=Effusibacillus dendaii TaxID=2743772 RepID=A0A7I8D4T1_9BACL|nr:hypothetical protein skT53_00700 [Effusibacillus dendaii]